MTPQYRIRLLVGLGNPGGAYAETRHNMGFMLIDHLAALFSIAVTREKFDVVFGRGRIADNEVLLAKPMAYMNRSGPPIRRLADYFGISGEEMLIVHDDIDLALNRLKIKKKGGHGGHNGVKSIIDAFGSRDFARLRIGIGRPEVQEQMVDHVLSRFTAKEREMLKPIINRAGEAAVVILGNGVEKGMNLFNQ